MIGAAIGVLTTAISNISNGIPFWHGMGKAAVIGAVSGAISFGIGEVTQGLSFISKAAMQAGLHGMKSGLMSAIEGGDFGSGFLAGAVSSMVSSGIEALGTDFGASATAGKQVMNKFGASSHFKAVMIASGGLSGGLSSAIAGGDFWKGVREGLITAGLNHAMHSAMDGDDNGYDKNGNKINDKGGDTTDYLYDDNGKITGSKSVFQTHNMSQGEFTNSDYEDFRGYGYKVNRMATGAVSEDNTFFELYSGGKAVNTGVNYLVKGFNAVKVPFFKALGGGIKNYFPKLGANRYFRIGISHSKGREVFRITKGNNLNHILDIDLGKIPNFKK